MESLHRHTHCIQSIVYIQECRELMSLLYILMSQMYKRVGFIYKSLLRGSMLFHLVLVPDSECAQ